jgi:dipeptidyl aminopeptidase/acylaminoacyl peptidase
MLMMRPFSFALCLLAAAEAAPAPRFSLEQALSSPFPDNLVAGPGGRVAWVLNARGARNIWVAEAPDYRGRRLTQYSGDDGQEIGQIRWTPDGRHLLYVRGGDLEHGLDNANPLSRPDLPEQAIWIASLADGVIRKLTSGASPAISSAGDRVAYLNKSQIWSVGLGENDKPSELVHARGRCGALTWSPDGASLAFVNDRGDHGFIGVYRPAAKSLRFMDPSVDSDFYPVWSPDSRQIAFVRIAASHGFRAGPQRSASEPWSIRIADVTTGAGRRIWRASAGPGSAFRGVVAEKQLLWGTGNRIVFPWEADGWTHLYSVSLDGGPAVLLTPGEFEVEHVSLSREGGEVVYSSNQGDIDRRHLWRVGVKPGESPRQVTSGRGIEWAPVALDGGVVAYLRSDAKRQARAALQSGVGPARDLVPDSIPSDFPESALVEPQPVMLSAADGMPIHGQLFLPSGTVPGKRPALVFFHGGSRRQMLLGWHYMYYYNNAYAMNQYLASQGYIVLSVNYRSGIGYGLNFREALNYGAAGASEFHDVMGAGLYLRSRADVDPARIGVWGGSYGGYLTALGLARASDLFAAGVDFHGVHDWSKLRPFEPNSAAARTAFESSPIASVKTWRSPVLLIHGDDDRNVAFSQTVQLVEALREQRVNFEELIFPDELHDFLTHGHWLEAYRAAGKFFAKWLNPTVPSSKADKSFE